MKIGIWFRLAAGFTVVIMLLAVTVGATIFQVGVIQNDTDRILNLRNPTARASSDLSSHIYGSLASLRGFMLTGSPRFREERAVIWRDIVEITAAIDGLSKNWTNLENNKIWNNLKSELLVLSAAQANIEAVAHTVDERPATKILVTTAAPLASRLSQKISKIIELEVSGNSSRKGDRHQLLGVMANIRDTLGLSLTSIRTYLLTGEKNFADEFGALWTRNEKHFSELRKSARLLSPPQMALFDEFKVARASFAPLPAKMFEIRSSEKWNMANYLLATEAIPRADKILELLLGAIQKDGSRDGGMTGSQQNLLEIDVRHSAAAARRLLLLQWLLLLAGASLATLIAYFTARSIVAPVKNMTSAMLCLADGEMNFEIPDQDRNDEIGDMAGAVQVFKENALEQDRLESEKLELFEELDFQKSAIDKHAIVSIADADGDIIYANDKFCEISGYTRQELLGQNHRILKSNEHSPAFYSDIWDTISAGKVWQGEIKNYRKDGEYYWIMSTIVPALDNDGKPLRYVSIRSDISERKEAEIAALAASRAKSELMANMSHELRTPLNAIIGFSGTMMAESFGPIDNEKYREYLGDIHSSGQHLLELIADILDVSAVEAGSLKLHRENINLPDLVAGIIRIIRPRAEENGLTVTSSVAAEITEIYADERRVKQILLNLLGNAVKYTPEGGDVAVNMSMNKGGVLIIEVSDTGIGMDADELSEAMSVFGRVARGLDRQTEGTGLGLPLTKGLVDLHDGTMEIKSEKGLGTTVTVTIPCAPISETAD